MPYELQDTTSMTPLKSSMDEPTSGAAAARARPTHQAQEGVGEAITTGVAAVGVLGAVFGICLSRRRRAAAQAGAGAPMTSDKAGAGAYPMSGMSQRGMRTSDSSAFVPLTQHANPSSMNLMGAQDGRAPSPYHDDYYGDSRSGTPIAQHGGGYGGYGAGQGSFDPYDAPRPSTASNLGPERYH